MYRDDGNVKTLSYTPIPNDFTILTAKKPKGSSESSTASTASSIPKCYLKGRPSLDSTASSVSTASSSDDYELRCSPTSICCCISVAIIILLSAGLVYIKLNPKPHEDNWVDHGFSEDETAYETEISSNLDATVKPCDDFYAYACNVWIAKNPIPKHQDIMSAFTIAGVQVERVTYNSLNRKPSEGGKQYKSDTAKSVIAARAIFQECMDKSNQNKLTFLLFTTTNAFFNQKPETLLA